MEAPGDATIRCVGGIAFDPHGRLLLIRRANDPGSGQWSLPGGRVEPGETDKEAVVRELSEETGLDVIPGTLVGTVTRGRYEIHDYRCAVAGGVLTAGDDATDARWSDAADLSALEAGGELVDLLYVTLRDWNALPRA
ncbi:Diadenosine hexaphosphate (Ap6A) hydrolase / Bis(5'-nucleosyl)-tetraphosphatase (Ap4A) (Asymmetrical) (EC [Amycolatopsis camponoti]|uniref:Diadenosine hexaphosphate (Ap6A) hydrolase / Bis(5'-nucleosyl)-tetraphosphatase (Ap4A) (Asymmetrical) (EC) n=1 Tax=Amycolatopsis camponoti TaxID=2606593 RepID=A0A6I8MA65_9PSEU|nr:NUDIX domain-containing protein [Amycolatopsis camponoti]VVJ24642.1 Diadenosine hexaphosphate (Ap6A) hydrolase / Bis(5'-nucleosyl)-tetraphosphatase (Ap4A) (Asymmetrical) (EC [Amycolatopsis camponoti]